MVSGSASGYSLDNWLANAFLLSDEIIPKGRSREARPILSWSTRFITLTDAP